MYDFSLFRDYKKIVWKDASGKPDSSSIRGSENGLLVAHFVSGG